MYINFNELSREARVWVYQADRQLSEAELALIEEAAPAFLQGWAAHGKSLKASFQLFHKQFLVIGVDEASAAASGCSIDSSVAFIRSLEKELNVNFMDRSKVAFVLDDQVYLEALPQLKNSIASGKITADTKTFNPTVSNKQELEENWLLPAGDSWLKRYFN